MATILRTCPICSADIPVSAYVETEGAGIIWTCNEGHSGTMGKPVASPALEAIAREIEATANSIVNAIHDRKAHPSYFSVRSVQGKGFSLSGLSLAYSVAAAALGAESGYLPADLRDRIDAAHAALATL